MSYLDSNGLAYFWAKLKAYITALLAPKANDTDVVHKTGNEIVNGEKTFTNYVFSNSGYFKKHPDAVKGSNPNTMLYWTWGAEDKNGIAYTDNCIGMFETSLSSSGVVSTYMRAMKNDATDNLNCTLGCIYNTLDNIGYTFAPTPVDSDSSTQIATTDWVKHHHCITVNVANDISKPYYRIATTGVITGSYNDRSITLLVEQAYITGGTGICTIHTRTEGSGNSTCEIYWIARNPKLDINCIQAAFYNVYGNTYCDIVYYARATYRGAHIYVLDMSDTRYIYHANTNGFELFRYSDANAASIGDLGLALHGRYYSSVLLPSDQFVSLDGVQTINGDKNFYDNVIVFNGNFIRKLTAVDVAVVPASKQTCSYITWDKNNHIAFDLLYYANSSAEGSGRGFQMRVSPIQTYSGPWMIISGGVTSAMKGWVEFGSDVKSVTPTAAGTTLGADSTSKRWGQIYSAYTTISTSDERLKTEVSSVPDHVLDCWGNVSWVQFRMLESLAEKGEAARIHTGLIAQSIDRTFANSSLDASRYGLFCYDEWDEEPEDKDEDGNVIRPAVPAGNQYSLRYEEALCMEAAYQRRENARLKKRVADLEERLAALELKIS